VLKREDYLPFISFIAGLLIAFLLSGYWYFAQKKEFKQAKMELETLKEERKVLTEEPNPITKVALYFIKDTADETFLVRELRELPYTSAPEIAAIKELIKGPLKEGLEPVLPARAKVRGLEIQNGLAILDLSQEAVKIGKGSWGEALVVWAIVNTLTKFPEIDAVQILIEGNSVETLAGHFDLSGILKRNEQVIKKD
jgi:spore germination protein GerM